MKLTAFKKTLSKEEAWQIAEKKGSLLWKAAFASKQLSEIRLRYIEYLIVEVKMQYKITPLMRIRTDVKGLLNSILRKNSTDLRDIQSHIQLNKKEKYGTHNLLMIVNGTSCSPSLVDVMPQMVRIDMDEDRYERIVQETDFSQDDIKKNAKKMAIRVMHRIVGGLPKVKEITIKSVYRPFYVAFYGDVVEGNKVRYITIPADGGHTSKRGEFA